jgi:hypothetical protein
MKSPPVRSMSAALSKVTAGWMTGLPFCSVVWKIPAASSVLRYTWRRTSSSRGVQLRGAAAAQKPVSNRWKIRTLACRDAREAYGSVLVSPTTMLSSQRSTPMACLKARLPTHELGQTTTVIPGCR